MLHNGFVYGLLRFKPCELVRSFAERSAAGKNGALEKEQGKPYTFLLVKDINIIEILI